MFTVGRDEHNSNYCSSVHDLSGLSDLSRCPFCPGTDSVSWNLQMQCNCSEMQKKKGLDCSAILFSLMWFILHLKISSKYINIRLPPQSPVLTSEDPCVVYRWLFLPSTFGTEFMCSGLMLEAQNFKSSPRTSTMCVRGKFNCLSWWGYSFQSRYTRKCPVQVCLGSILTWREAVQGLETFESWIYSSIAEVKTFCNKRDTIKMLLLSRMCNSLSFFPYLTVAFLRCY